MTAREMKAKDLKPHSRKVNLTVKVLNKGEFREVSLRRNGSKHRVADALVGDETGCVLFSLWDEKIDKIEVGSVIRISNGYCSTFQDSMRLNIGWYGTLTKVEEDIPEVNTENNLSEHRFG